MSSPVFSIVICCWNSKAHIADAVESVLKQTESSFELVFVDGGSDDGTLEYIEQVKWPHKVVLNGVRGGIANAMNRGITAAHGRFVAHLHSDDYYLNDEVLSHVRAAIESHPDAAWLYGRFYNDIDGKVGPPAYQFRPYSLRNLRRRNIVPHVSTFVRRDVFEQCGGFDPQFRLAMDYEFWLRIASRYGAVQIDHVLGVFRRHAGSATSANALASFNEDFKARFKHSPWWLWPEFAGRYLVRRLRET